MDFCVISVAVLRALTGAFIVNKFFKFHPKSSYMNYLMNFNVLIFTFFKFLKKEKNGSTTPITTQIFKGLIHSFLQRLTIYGSNAKPKPPHFTPFIHLFPTTPSSEHLSPSDPFPSIWCHPNLSHPNYSSQTFPRILFPYIIYSLYIPENHYNVYFVNCFEHRTTHNCIIASTL